MFYEKGNLNDLIERMTSENERNDSNSLLNYHIQLVLLLAMCTEGKNASTEIKCHSLVGLDDSVLIVTHPDTIPEVRRVISHLVSLSNCFDFQVKNAYITFLNHCYIDTEVEMKEIYNSQHIYTLIEKSFCPDIEKVSGILVWNLFYSQGKFQLLVNYKDNRSATFRKICAGNHDRIIDTVFQFTIFRTIVSSTGMQTERPFSGEKGRKREWDFRISICLMIADRMRSHRRSSLVGRYLKKKS